MEGRPHTAMKLTKLLNTSVDVFSLTATPAQYVQGIIARAQTMPVTDQETENTSLKALQKQLEDLVHLWDEHNYRISLADYSLEDAKSISLALLDRVAAPELLGVTIKESFDTYAARHELPRDDILSEYCQEIMDTCSTCLCHFHI
jgi:hypothetical protein